MADSDKNIRITTNKNKPTNPPNIVFTGSSAGTSVLTLEVRDDNTVAFTGIDGDVFSLDYNLSTGTIWSVNDKSGTPFLRASAGGTIGIAELGANVRVGIGQTNPQYKLDVQGWVGFASTGDGSYTALFENGAATGNNALSIRAANALRFYNSTNTLYTGFKGAQSGVNTTYTLPATSPATGSSVLQSTSAGIMSWVPMFSTAGLQQIAAGSYGYVQYAGINNAFASVSAFQYEDQYGQLVLTNYPFITPTNGTANLQLLGTGQFWNGSDGGTFLAINAGTGFTGDLIHAQFNGVSRLQLNADGYLRLGVAGTGFTLPITNGTSGQVLTANTNGIASWSTVSSSGAGSGTVAIPGAQYQIAGYYWSATGASVSGSTTFTNNTATGVVDINHTTESTSTTTGALVVDGGAGIAKSLFVGTTLSVGQAAGYNIPNILGTFVSTVNSYNQLVIQNKSNGTSASANLVVNNDSSTDTTFYGEIGMNSSTFSGTGALGAPNATYVSATSGPLVLGTTTAHPIRFVVNGAATDTLFIDGAGTAISCFVNFGLRSASDLRFWNSGNTFYAGLQGGNTAASYLLSMPTGQVGAGASVIVTGSDGLQYFAAPGSGIAFSSATANTPLIRTKRALTMQFCAGFTPTAAGPDFVVLKVPESATDGISDITFRLRELDIRVETPSAGSSRIQLEKYVGTTAFTLAATGSSMIGGLGITLSGAGIYFTSTNSFLAGSFVTSNDKLRLSWTLLNATHANFSVQLTMEEV